MYGTKIRDPKKIGHEISFYLSISLFYFMDFLNYYDLALKKQRQLELIQLPLKV